MKARGLSATCGGGARCTLDAGHKGPCVQQRMPQGSEADSAHDEWTFDTQREIDLHRNRLLGVLNPRVNNRYRDSGDR